MERRTLIRLLVIIGIGIPLLVEGITFLGLLEAQLLGGGTPTPSPEGVGVGEEVLPETAPADTLSTASLSEEGGERLLTLTVKVDNTGNGTYELRLRGVTTDGGETIGGNASTGDVRPGESTFVTEQWVIPADTRPASVTVVAITVEDGQNRRVEKSVALARIG